MRLISCGILLLKLLRTDKSDRVKLNFIIQINSHKATARAEESTRVRPLLRPCPVFLPDLGAFWFNPACSGLACPNLSPTLSFLDKFAPIYKSKRYFRERKNYDKFNSLILHKMCTYNEWLRLKPWDCVSQVCVDSFTAII